MSEKNKSRVCGVCDFVIHDTSECPHQPQEPQDPNEEQVCGIWESNNNKPKYSPFDNFYNPATKDHPNLKWRDPNDNSKPNFGQSYNNKQQFQN